MARRRLRRAPRQRPDSSAVAGSVAAEVHAAGVALPNARVIASFLFTFVCLFAGMTLPWANFGATYSRVFSETGNVLIGVLPSPSHLEVSLSGSEERPAPLTLGIDTWRTVVTIRNTRSNARFAVPLDLRGAHYVPAATFIALTVALPLAGLRRKVLMLIAGLSVLIPLSLILVSLPLIPRLRGGEFELFSVSATFNSFVVIFYRAFVAHPGMAYAIPALLWWAFLPLTRPGSRLDDSFRRLGLRLRGLLPARASSK